MGKFKRKYGFWAAFALTLTGTLGSSLLISYNVVTFLSGFDPVFLILAWLLGGLAILPENLIMIEPAISYKENGTTYAWVKRAGWKVVGFWFGWILVVAVSAAAIAGIAIALGQLSSILVDRMSGTTNWLANEWIAKGIGLGILAFLVIMQIMIKNSGKYTQYIFWVLTILPILFMLIMAVVYGNMDETLSVSSKHSLNKSMGSIFLSSGMLIPAITYTSYAYSGVEFSTYITGEIKQPEKTVPKVIIFSVLAIIVIYVVYGLALLSLTTTDMLGDPANVGSPTDVPVPMNLIRMPIWAQITFQVMAIFLFIGSINTFLVTYTWLVYKLAEERDLFSWFKKMNKNSVPWRAMLFVVLIGVIYILADDLYKIIGYFTISVSVLKIIMATTTVYLRRTDPSYIKVFKSRLFYPLLALSYFTAIMIFGGGIAAIFFLQPESSSATWQLVFDIIFMVVLIALIPVGYLKFYFQDYKKKAQIRLELGLKSNKELKAEYLNDRNTYHQVKKEQEKLVTEKLDEILNKKNGD